MTNINIIRANVYGAQLLAQALFSALPVNNHAAASK